ncbi:MAG: porin family protein [Steroidobacteraceae bacterium]
MRWTMCVAGGVLAASAAMAHDGYGDGRYADRRYDEDTGTYVGLNVGQIRYSEDGLGAITPNGGYFRIGQAFSPNFAIEGRVGGGFSEDSTDGYAVRVDALYAGYIKGSLPLAPGFSLYALGGLGGAHLRRNFGDGNVTESGFSYGLGGDFALGNGTAINVEWSRLVSGTNFGYDFDTDIASIGLTFRF